MKPETSNDPVSFFYAVMEGEDEQGNPIYGELQEFTGIKKWGGKLNGC